MKSNLFIVLAIWLLFAINVSAQPVFQHAGQTIELTETAMTSDFNATSIVVGSSTISVQQYSFDFSVNGFFTSNATGWCGIVNAGYTSARISTLVPNIEIGSTYYVRVCYKSNNSWYASPVTSTFATKFGDIYSFYYSAGASIDLGEAALMTDEYNLFYPSYRFEFSTSPSFTNFPNSNSNPQGWYAEINTPTTPGIDLRNSVDNLEVGQHYWVRVKVKTATMTGWSQPSSIVKDFYTINNKAIGYGNNSNVDLFVHGLTANDGFTDYPYYRFEFSPAASNFTEYPNAPTNMYIDNPPINSPRIGTLITGLGVDKTYLCRVRVKTNTMQAWSAPGPTITLNTVNLKSFRYCGENNLNIKTAQLSSTDYYTNQYYSDYLFEFCKASDFSSQPVLSSSGLFTYQNAPKLIQVLPTMQHSTVYYTRVKVKTPNDNNWSLPGPVCSFTTSACVPDAGVCPSYSQSCTYKPLNYYSFDNDCDWLSDCVGSSGVGTFTYYVQRANSASQVGKGLDARLTPTATNVRSQAYFGNNYSASSNGDYTIEFCFKIGVDADAFVMRSDMDANGNYYLPYFEITGQSIRAIVTENPPQFIRKTFIGMDRLSADYYYDRGWHHVALRYNSSTKEFRMFIDGQCPSDFQLTLPSNVSPPNPGSGDPWDRIYKLDVRSSAGDVSIDEMAFYDVPLPDNVVYQHYQSFMNHQHYNACEVNPNITVPSPGPLTNNIYDPLEFPPGYDTDILTPGIDQTYMHCNLVSLPTTYNQITSYPAPRYKPGHGLNPNINWTDSKYLAMTYTGSCSGLNQVFSAANDVNIQEELCKNWNYMFNLPLYSSVTDNSTVNAFLNGMSSNYKVSVVTLMPYFKKLLNQTPSYTADINMSGLNIGNGDIATPSACSSYTPTTFLDPTYKDEYKLYARATLKNLLKKCITEPNLNSLTPLTRKIDYVSENGFETRLAPYGSVGTCLYSNSNSSILTDKGSMSWDDYYGHVIGNNWYKSYADELISSPTSAIYDNQSSSALFHTGTKVSFYLTTAIYGQNSPVFENYSTKRVCNTPYSSMHYSTPNFYPWSGPFGWYNGASQYWGLYELNYRIQHEIPLGDKLYAPFVSARWGLDVDAMRPGQYLGFLKALAMFGVDFYHLSYFNVTDNQNNWLVKRHTGDNVGFANDPRTWVWQLSSASYAQAIISRYEPFIRNGSIISSGKFGNEYYVVSKMDNANKYLIYTTMQKLSNWAGNSVLAKDIYLPNFNAVHSNFKVNARRQGSTYVLDVTGSAPVFYQLDKWHQYEHPGYWTKDIDFEAEVDDSGNNLDLVTEFNSNISLGDYTNYTTGAKLSGSNNFVKHIFTPRDNTSNNNYQIWIRMKKTGTGTGKLEVKVDGVNTYIVDNIGNTSWQWYGYESCLGNRMLLNSLSASNHTLVLVSGTDNLIIDQICLKKNLTMTLQAQPSACSNCCNYDNAYSERIFGSNTGTMVVQKEEASGCVIKVFPNPSSTTVFITSEGFKPLEKYTISIINSVGVEVKRIISSPISGRIEVETVGIANGLYSLMIEDNSTSVKGTAKLVVQH